MFNHPGHTASLAFVLLATLASACGSNPPPKEPSYDSLVAQTTVDPANDVERETLSLLATVQAPSTETVRGTSVLIGEPYDSASGRSCLRLRIGDAPERLACLIDGAWAFVPEVAPGASAN